MNRKKIFAPAPTNGKHDPLNIYNANNTLKNNLYKPKGGSGQIIGTLSSEAHRRSTIPKGSLLPARVPIDFPCDIKTHSEIVRECVKRMFPLSEK